MWSVELAVARQGQNPIGKDSISRFQIEGEMLPVGRPVDGRAIDISVVLIENFFGLATVERVGRDRVLTIFNGRRRRFAFHRATIPAKNHRVRK